jgi:hypothetical protein
MDALFVLFRALLAYSFIAGPSIAPGVVNLVFRDIG